MKTTLISLAAAAFAGQAAATSSYGPDSNPACSELAGGADAYDICDKNTGECVNIMSFNLFYHYDDAWKEPENCGACGQSCPGDDSVCSMGECCPHSAPLWCPMTKRCHKAAPYPGPPVTRVRMVRSLTARVEYIPITEYSQDDPCKCADGYVFDQDAPNMCRSCAAENAMQVGEECKECKGGAIASDDGLHCLCPPGLAYTGPGANVPPVPVVQPVAVVPRDGGRDHSACKPCPGRQIADKNSVCQPCEGDVLEPNEWGTECVCPKGWVPNALVAEKCEKCEGDKVAYMGNCITCPENTVPNGDHTQCVCATEYAWIHDKCTKCADVGAVYDTDSRGCKCPENAKFDDDYKCHCRPGMELVEDEQNGLVCKECAHDMVSEDGLKCHQCPVPLTADIKGAECICDIYGATFVDGQCKCPENMKEVLGPKVPDPFNGFFRGCCQCDDNAVPSDKYESGCMVCKDLDEPRVPNKDGTSCVKCSVNKVPNEEGTECVCKPGYKANAEYGCDKEDGGEEPKPDTCDGADLQTDAKNCGKCGNVCEATDKPSDVKDRWWWRWWGAVGQYRPQTTGECKEGKCF